MMNGPAITSGRAFSLRSVESAGDYSKAVATLNDSWRVISCRDGIQWILQYRNRSQTVARDAWRGRSYCRTREALIRVCDIHAGLIRYDARVVLAGLSECFPEKQSVRGQTSESVFPLCVQQVGRIDGPVPSSGEVQP
jgi:hypothetical protein